MSDKIDLRVDNLSAGVTTVQAGTALLPALTTTGDTNTGVWFPAADTIAASTAGVERLRVTSTGLVGIGTSSPAEELHITSAIPTIRLEDSDDGSRAEILYNVGSGGLILRSDQGASATSASNIIAVVDAVERLRITSAGDVGIGTTNIVGESLGTQGKALSLSLSSDINGNSTSNSVTGGGKLISLSGISGSNNYTAASFGIHQTGSAEGVGEFRFSTGNGAGTLTERLRITSTGNVAIGTSSPNYKLDVNGTFGFTPGASVTPADNGDVVFELTNNTTLTVKAKGSDGVVRSGTIVLA